MLPSKVWWPAAPCECCGTKHAVEDRDCNALLAWLRVAQREVTWSGQPHMPRAPWTSQVGNAAAAALRAVEQARLAAAEQKAQPDTAAPRHPEGGALAHTAPGDAAAAPAARG
jgi:hypothetical protein